MASKEDTQLVFLRRLVKTLGVILIVGTVFVVTLAVTRLMGGVSGKRATAAAVCKSPAKDIVLPIPGEVTAMYKDPDGLILALKDGHERTLVWLDSCEGTLIRTLRLIK